MCAVRRGMDTSYRNHTSIFNDLFMRMDVNQEETYDTTNEDVGEMCPIQITMTDKHALIQMSDSYNNIEKKIKKKIPLDE